MSAILAFGKATFPSLASGAPKYLLQTLVVVLLGIGIYAIIDIPWMKLLFASPYGKPVFLEMSLIKALVLHTGFSTLLISVGHLVARLLK